MEIKNRWKEYCEGLLNEENTSGSLPAAAPDQGLEPKVTMGEVTTVIKNMKPRIAGELSQITSDILNFIVKNAEYLRKITTKI